MTKTCKDLGQPSADQPWKDFRGCSERLSPAFREALATRHAAKDAGLGVAAGEGVGQDVDGVEAIHGAIFRYLIAQPERVKALFNTHVNPQAVHLHHPVDLPSSVTNGNAVAVAAIPWTGMFFHSGKHFLVDGQRVYALDALCFHGVISPLDLAWFTGIESALSVVLAHASQHQDLKHKA